MKKPMRAVKADMQWRGRKLLCNGVCVAVLWKNETGRWFYFGGYSSPEHWSTHTVSGQRVSEAAARRAINRRFSLPLDLGDAS